MLTITNVNVTFNSKKKVLDNLDLRVFPGEFVVIIGSNGAGKSTLLNLITGDLTAETGSVTIANTNVTTWPSFKRAELIAKVVQNPSIATAGSLTIAENLSFALLRGLNRNLYSSNTTSQRVLFTKKLQELTMGLENRLDDLVSDLSGGQRQVLSLVMATLSESQVLLLDEHTAALDPKTAAMVMTITDKLIRQNNLTTLMITHNMSNALRYGDRILFLEDGKITKELSFEEKKRVSTSDLAAFFNRAT